MQFIESMKVNSKVNVEQKKYLLFKRHCYYNVTILDALQRNFLDYFKTSLEEYLPVDDCKVIRSKLKRLLIWYVFIFGEADINPEIYVLTGIDPFENILDGKNIFHFICQYNCSSTL